MLSHKFKQDHNNCILHICFSKRLNLISCTLVDWGYSTYSTPTAFHIMIKSTKRISPSIQNRLPSTESYRKINSWMPKPKAAHGNKSVSFRWEIFQPDANDVSTDNLRYSLMGAPPGLHQFYVRTSILFDLLHGLHNVFPLSLQNTLLYEHSK